MSPSKPTVPEVLPLLQDICRHDNTGCCLHVMVADGNFSDEIAWWCVLGATVAEHGDCQHVADLMLRMSPTQRRKLSARVDMTWEYGEAGHEGDLCTRAHCDRCEGRPFRRRATR